MVGFVSARECPVGVPSDGCVRSVARFWHSEGPHPTLRVAKVDGPLKRQGILGQLLAARCFEPEVCEQAFQPDRTAACRLALDNRQLDKHLAEFLVVLREALAIERRGSVRSSIVMGIRQR